MFKIVFVGAGSAVFTRNLVGDLLSLPELRNSITFSLMDLDAGRLETAELLVRRLVEAHDAAAVVQATQDRRTALQDADYVVTCFQVGGYRPATVIDFEVPKRHGLRQTIADTLGVGGIMRGLRTIPVLLDVCRDMEDVCPDALLLNYVNPMAMLCWAVAEASLIRTVGLCHSVQHTAAELAADLGLPAEELDSRRRASTTWRSSCASNATARISIRRCSACCKSNGCRPPTACAMKCCGISARS